MVMEPLQEDMGEGTVQCTNHPYKNHTPGGICAFCLQEKLGKLVSSSFPIAIFPSSSSSPSPSFRSECTLPVRQNASTNTNRNDYHPRRARIPFLPTQKKKKKMDGSLSSSQASIEFKRSKSTATPRRGVHFMGVVDGDDDYSPRKRGFLSFLYLSKHSNSSSVRKIEKPNKEICYSSSSSSIGAVGQRSRETQKREENDDSPNQAAVDRKVSRSRSVGCGSRSFSGDFFERISTGFGDCTLRRVESQREGKPKVTPGGGGGGGQDCIKERVKCGGIFSGFMITSSSSSSSSSSYWVSSSGEDYNASGKAAATPSATAGHLAHGRSKSWGWAFASPIRAFSKPSSRKREKNTTRNLNAIPSLLAVGG